MLHNCELYNTWGARACLDCSDVYYCYSDGESPCDGYCPAFQQDGIAACRRCSEEEVP